MSRRRANPYLLITLAVLFWSGNMVLGRGIRADIPPLALAFWRWTIAFALTLPLAWAYFGIWQQHQAQGAYLGQYPAIGWVAIAISAVYVLIAIYVFIQNGYCLLPKPKAQKQA